MKPVVSRKVDNGRVDFEKLANQHKDAVYRQMLRVCGNHADAEDVMIDALFKAYRHLDQLDDSVSFRPWLAQIARRVCWQIRRREALLPLLQLSTVDSEIERLAASTPHPEDAAALSEMRAILKRAVGNLPEPYRQAYELRDLEDLPGPEVAVRLGISVAAMKSRVHRARALVRASLDAALIPTARAVESIKTQ
jgi:RNA polymerase sigma-70 factor (ECF subfamily)